MTMFTIEGREFGWDEIAVAAEVWGEWPPFVESVRQSLACLRFANRTGQMPPADEMRQIANAFRYARNLISAEDARSWLARWQITVEDWMNYLRGQSLRDRWAMQLKDIVAANPVGDEEVAQAIKRHAVCADKLGQWAVRLAGRAAVAANSGSLDAGESSRDLIARIETEFERLRQQMVTSKLIETRIALHRLDWIRFDCRYVWFGEERIAREAAFCVIEDGLTLDEVAWDARGIVQQWDFYLDEIEPLARPHFLAARQGDWLGPVKLLEGFPLFSILAKRMPSADDPRIRERAEQSIIASFTRQAINQRVRWVIL
jgi:hypothetical protein